MISGQGTAHWVFKSAKHPVFSGFLQTNHDILSDA